MTQTNSFVIDIHIPFVSKQLKFLPDRQLIGDHAARMDYLCALEAEAKAVAPDITGEVKAIRLSGPSPSIMSPDGLSHLLGEIRSNFTLAPHCEISIAALPQTIGTPSLTGWGAGGINRVHLLADTLQPTELLALDRPFDSVQIQNALLFLDKFRHQNVDVTLSIGIPGQTEATLMQNLRSLSEIDTVHITLKPLQVAGDGVLSIDNQKELLQKASERLVSYGYHHYAPGCFAKDDHWISHYAQALSEGAQLIGLGLGAKSNYNDIAYTNGEDFHTYIQSQGDAEKIIAEVHSVDRQYQQSISVFNRLKFANDFSRHELEQECGPLLATTEDQLQNLEAEGLITCEENCYHLTEAGQFRWLFL